MDWNRTFRQIKTYQSVGAWTVSRRFAGSSPRPDLNMECGLVLGEVPVHLLPCRGALEQGTGHPSSPLTPITPRALYNSCPLLLVLDSWYSQLYSLGLFSLWIVSDFFTVATVSVLMCCVGVTGKWPLLFNLPYDVSNLCCLLQAIRKKKLFNPVPGFIIA